MPPTLNEPAPAEPPGEDLTVGRVSGVEKCWSGRFRRSEDVFGDERDIFVKGVAFQSIGFDVDRLAAFFGFDRAGEIGEFTLGVHSRCQLVL